MKKLNFLLLLVISISFVGAQIPVDSKFNFSDDLNPSEKRLKSMIKGGDEIEGANYLVYLVNNLFAQISKESTLENSYGSVHRNYSSKGIKIRSYCSEILSKYAIPLSNNGNVKAVALINQFMSINNQSESKFFNEFDLLIGSAFMETSKILRKIKLHSPEDHLIYFELQQFINDPGFNFKPWEDFYEKYGIAAIEKYQGEKNTNKIERTSILIAGDTNLTKYLESFSKDELLNLRVVLNKRWEEINNTQIKKADNRYYYPEIIIDKVSEPITSGRFNLEFDVADNKSDLFYLRNTRNFSDENYFAENAQIICARNHFGTSTSISAEKYLKSLIVSIDLILFETNPQSMWYALKVLNEFKVPLKNSVDYSQSKNQYFLSDKNYAGSIFKLLAGSIQVNSDYNKLKLKTFYLLKSTEFSQKDAFGNLAALYDYLYRTQKKQSFNDSCIKYIELGIKNNIDVCYLYKGLKLFNGEGYNQNKTEAIKFIETAKRMKSILAIYLLENFPNQLFKENVRESWLNDNYIDIKTAWDFKLLCSNGCGNRVYPNRIEYLNLYNDNKNIIGANLSLDANYNPRLDITDLDFYSTFKVIDYCCKGYGNHYLYKNLFCSDNCVLESIKKSKNKIDEQNAEISKYYEEKIKCPACSKLMKRGEMIQITECPCAANQLVSFSQGNYWRVCSLNCKLIFCKNSCIENGINAIE